MTTTAPGRRFAVALDLSRSHVFARVGRMEVFAQREAASSPFRVSRPGPGERVIDLRGWSIAVTDHHRRQAANATLT